MSRGFVHCLETNFYARYCRATMALFYTIILVVTHVAPTICFPATSSSSSSSVDSSQSPNPNIHGMEVTSYGMGQKAGEMYDGWIIDWYNKLLGPCNSIQDWTMILPIKHEVSQYEAFDVRLRIGPGAQRGDLHNLISWSLFGGFPRALIGSNPNVTNQPWLRQSVYTVSGWSGRSRHETPADNLWIFIQKKDLVANQRFQHKIDQAVMVSMAWNCDMNEHAILSLDRR